VDFPVESVMDWGMLGYSSAMRWASASGAERRIAAAGRCPPQAPWRGRASSGGVEMYHVVGVTPEALTLIAALGARAPVTTIHYGAPSDAVYEI
jgi:predicted aconitase